MILVKDKNLNDVLIGNKHVSQIYLGNQLVWESAPTVFFDNAPIVPWAGCERVTTGGTLRYDDNAIEATNILNTLTLARVSGNIIQLRVTIDGGHAPIVTAQPVKVPRRMKYLCVHATRNSVFSPTIRIGFAKDGYTTPGSYSTYAVPYLTSTARVTANGDDAIFYCEIPSNIIGSNNYHVCIAIGGDSTSTNNLNFQWDIDKVWFDKNPPEDGRLLTY